MPIHCCISWDVGALIYVSLCALIVQGLAYLMKYLPSILNADEP